MHDTEAITTVSSPLLGGTLTVGSSTTTLTHEDGKPCLAVVYGPGSDKYVAAQTRKQRAAMQRLQRGGIAGHRQISACRERCSRRKRKPRVAIKRPAREIDGRCRAIEQLDELRASHDRAMMEAASPARQASRIQAPVLLIHGTEDRIVAPKQSRIMAQALKAAGKPVELVELPDVGHRNLDVDDWKLVYTKSVAHIARAFSA